MSETTPQAAAAPTAPATASIEQQLAASQEMNKRASAVIKECQTALESQKAQIGQLQAKLSDNVKQASERQGALDQIGEKLIDKLVKNSFVDASRKAEAKAALADPVKVAKQLDAVLDRIDVAGAAVGHVAREAKQAAADGENPMAEADARYLQRTGQA